MPAPRPAGLSKKDKPAQLMSPAMKMFTQGRLILPPENMPDLPEYIKALADRAGVKMA